MPNKWIEKYPDVIDADESDFVAVLHPQTNSQMEILEEAAPWVVKRFIFTDFHLVGSDWTSKLKSFRVTFSQVDDHKFSALTYFEVDTPVQKADDRNWRDVGILFELLSKSGAAIATTYMSMNRRCGNYLVEKTIPGGSQDVKNPITYAHTCRVTVTYHTRVTWC